MVVLRVATIFPVKAKSLFFYCKIEVIKMKRMVCGMARKAAVLKTSLDIAREKEREEKQAKA